MVGYNKAQPWLSSRKLTNGWLYSFTWHVFSQLSPRLWQTLCLCWSGPPCHSQSILGNQPRPVVLSLWYFSFTHKCSTSRLLFSETQTDQARIVLHISGQSFRHHWFHNYRTWLWYLKGAGNVRNGNSSYNCRAVSKIKFLTGVSYLQCLTIRGRSVKNVSQKLTLVMFNFTSY